MHARLAALLLPSSLFLAALRAQDAQDAHDPQDSPRVSFTPSAALVDAYDFVEVAVEVKAPLPKKPFTDASVEGDFQIAAGSPVRVEGFCDSADGSVHRIRFMPSRPGAYSCSVTYMEGRTVVARWKGAFRARDAGRKGILRVDREHPWHFVWEGAGGHYFWNGTTTYWLAGWDDETIRRSIDRLADLKVNRLRVCLNGRLRDGRDWNENVYPTSRFAFRLNPWVAVRPESINDPGFDVTRFNVPHWQKYERLLRHARERDVVVSVIFYLDGNKPGMDPFGKARAGGADEQRYYRHAVARLGAFSNVLWDLSNEYRFLRDEAWADKMGALLEEWDPYDHLASVHGYGDFRFRTSPWADFAMYQSWDEHGGHGFLLKNRELQAKTGRIIPQVNEEYGYEDHYPVGWGENRKPPARSADNRRRLAWEMYMAGGYQTTGERADRGTGWGSDSGGGWINGRGDDEMVMLKGYAHIVDFFRSFEWWKTEPRSDLVGGGALCLAEPGKTYAVYLPRGGATSAKIEEGEYLARWLNCSTGEWSVLASAHHPSGVNLQALGPGGADWAALLTRTMPPLALHPENPRHFLFRGKPAVLITSGEHYGAVLNLDFDYGPYLDELARCGFNLTRTFSGAYREIPGSFGIRDNTLAPQPNRFICPWARSDTPGYSQGGSKFDLSRWDEAYFARLKDFLARASSRGVVVELVLFCPMYEDALWKANPMNASNNVNGVGNVPSNEVYTLKHKDLLEVQTRLVRKIVAELKDFDNVYYEICNEPYFGGVTLEWQRHIASVIAESESEPCFRWRHLIAQNIANRFAKVEDPHPAVSIFNFHYASPPTAVAMNWALGKPIAFDESGFRGSHDTPYRTEAWDFILAGGAAYSNLDYSFTPSREDGTASISAPGGGGPALRSQLKILNDFIEGFDFVKMAPDAAVVQGGVPAGLSARALSEKGKAYALYFHNQTAGGPFSVRWTGQVEPRFSETYTFHTISNDGVRLWVDGKLVVENWTDHAAKEDSGTIALDAGTRHGIKLELYQNGGSAAAKLSWSSASQKKEIVPGSRLWLPDGGGNGLKAEYFEDRDLGKLRMQRVDRSIDFDWSSSSPFEAGPEGTRMDLVLDLPPGTYRAEWLNTLTGAVEREERFTHAGGARTLASPAFKDDIALRVRG